MLALTGQQQKVLAGVLLLLLVGWAVQTWRLAHPTDEIRPIQEIDAEREL
ncbi:MAG: hypothetical protein KF833_20865 [Verrucomicrobiae bacterium]|nr:hypothetical protein [Verrucomicrobiae bacterium]